METPWFAAEEASIAAMELSTTSITKGRRYIYDGWMAVAERKFEAADSGTTTIEAGASKLERIYVTGPRIDEWLYAAIDFNSDGDIGDDLNSTECSWSGGVAGKDTADAAFYYYTDASGRVAALGHKNSDRKILEYYRYRAFGEMITLPVVDDGLAEGSTAADGLEDSPLSLTDNNTLMLTLRTTHGEFAGRVSWWGNGYRRADTRYSGKTGLDDKPFTGSGVATMDSATAITSAITVARHGYYYPQHPQETSAGEIESGCDANTKEVNGSKWITARFQVQYSMLVYNAPDARKPGGSEPIEGLTVPNSESFDYSVLLHHDEFRILQLQEMVVRKCNGVCPEGENCQRHMDLHVKIDGIPEFLVLIERIWVRGEIFWEPDGSFTFEARVTEKWEGLFHVNYKAKHYCKCTERDPNATGDLPGNRTVTPPKERPILNDRKRHEMPGKHVPYHEEL